MTRFALIAAAMTALAAIPAAAGSLTMKEQPDMNNFSQVQMQQVDRRAGDLFNARELDDRNLMPGDTVSVSSFPSGMRVDDTSRDRM